MTNETFKKILGELKNKIINNHIENISIVNNCDLVFSFSFLKKERLFISLNNLNPMLGMLDSFINIPSFPSKLKDILRLHIKDGYILNVNIINEDRVFELEIIKNQSLVLREKKYLIFEMIPKRPRLIILNEERKIIYSNSYDNLLNGSRIILNSIYQAPIKKVETYNKIDKNYKDELLKYIDFSIKKGIKERHEKLFNYIPRRIKSLYKKLDKIKEDYNEGIKDLSYKDHADTLYTLEGEELYKYIKENKLNYDVNISLYENANKFYKKYKKAKGKIEASKKQEILTIEEIEYLTRISQQLEKMDEKDIPYLEETILHEKNPKFKRNYIEAKLPYFITYNGIKIGFGKNDAQNNYLTFELAKRDFYYFHIDKYNGPHVVVFSNNLNQDLIDIASDIAIYFSKEKSGDVISTQIKNVKKTKTLGLVNLSNTTLYRVDEVNLKTIDLLKDAVKFSR